MLRMSSASCGGTPVLQGTRRAQGNVWVAQRASGHGADGLGMDADWCLWRVHPMAPFIVSWGSCSLVGPSLPQRL